MGKRLEARFVLSTSRNMPHVSGMRPAELEQLLSSIAGADPSVFGDIPGHVLSEAAAKLSALSGPLPEWKLAVNKHNVVLITMSWCPYCTIVENLLKALDVGVEVFAVDKLPDMEDRDKQKEYMKAVKAVTGEHRVPQLFISQKYIGEYDDIVDESGGKGKEVLKPAVKNQIMNPSITVSGWAACPFYIRARKALLNTEGITVNVVEHVDKPAYKAWLPKAKKEETGFAGGKAQDHVSSPIVWMSDGTFIGGHDDTMSFLAGRQQQASPGMEWKMAVDSRKVVLITKSWCPYYTIAQNLLTALDVGVEVFEVDKLPGMDDDKTKQADYMKAVKEISGEHRVPQLFIGQKYVGEYDDIVDESGGKGNEALKATMLAAVRAGNPDLAGKPSGGGAGG